MKLLVVFTSSQSAYYFMDGQFQYLAEHNIQITILLPDDGFAQKVKERLPNIDVYIIPIKRKISPLADMYAFLSLVRHIALINPDIIHLHMPKAGLLGAVAAKLLFKKNVVFHLHGLVSVKGGRVIPGLTFELEKPSIRLADRVLAVSPSLKSFCIENGLTSGNKIDVLNHGTINGIDFFGRFSNSNYLTPLKIRGELNLSNKFVIGFLGRVNEDKGINSIIYVFRALRKVNRHISLCIVGPNEMSIAIESLFEIEELSNITIIDRVENPEHYLKMFDLHLFLSVREGFGLVLAEASALGTPSVAFDIFGVKDAVKNGLTGTLVPFGDLVAVIAACQAYIDCPNLLEEHSINGIEYVRSKFNKNEIWLAQKEYYKMLLDI